MTIEEKYQVLIEGIKKMSSRFNYYAAFAAFGDSLPDEIWNDVNKLPDILIGNKDTVPSSAAERE